MDPTTTCCPNRHCPASGHTGQGYIGIHWRRMFSAGAVIVLVGLRAGAMLPRGQRPVAWADTTPPATPAVTAYVPHMPAEEPLLQQLRPEPRSVFNALSCACMTISPRESPYMLPMLDHHRRIALDPSATRHRENRASHVPGII
jgi:hypothetical protein